MNINITLLGEMVTFAAFVWITMRFIWPPLMKAMNDRQKNIADGIEAGERGKKNLELAQKKVTEQLRGAKKDAEGIIEQANQRVTRMLEQAKDDARKEGGKILSLAKADIQTEIEGAKHELHQQTANLVVAAAEKVLCQNIDKSANDKLLNQLLGEI